MRVLIVMNGPATIDQAQVLGRRMPELFGHLAGHRVEVSLLLLSDEGGLARILGAAVPVRVLPVAMPPSGASLRAMPSAVSALRGALRDCDVDVLEGDEPMPAIALGLASFGRHVTLVYRRHHGAGHGFLRVASRAAARLADSTIVSTDALRTVAASDDHVLPERIHIASSGTVDLRPVRGDEVDVLRTLLEIGANDAVVLALTRFRREKGLDVLLDAVDDVTVDRPLHIVLAGTGPEEALLRASAARRRTPVHFVGHQDDIAPWLALATTIAMPSRRESFGRTTVETMAAGRPLVASAVGGLVEAVDHGSHRPVGTARGSRCPRWSSLRRAAGRPNGRGRAVPL